MTTAKFTEFHKGNFADVRAAIEKHFAAIEAETGIKLSMANMVFGDNSFRTQLTGMLSASIADPMLEGVEPKWISDFNRYREFEGCLLRKVTIGDKEYVVVGLHGRTKFIMRENKPGSKLVTFRFEHGDRVYNKVTGRA